jgi:hypothetical protein
MLSKTINYSFMANLCKLAIALIVPAALSYATATPATADTLWYNGDPNGQDSTRNSFNIFEPSSALGLRLTQLVLDDFIVPTTDEGWYIDSVWSNNLLRDSTRVSGVAWSIEQFLPTGCGISCRPYERTIITSGSSPATITPTNFTVSGSDYSVYTVTASGLNINLSPGTYWLSVIPQYISDSPTDAPFSNIATTSGTNAVGIPPGNNGRTFELRYGPSFLPSNPGTRDFSMGIDGRVSRSVPEPSSVLSILTIGAFGLSWRVLRKPKSTSRVSRF